MASFDTRSRQKWLNVAFTTLVGNPWRSVLLEREVAGGLLLTTWVSVAWELPVRLFLRKVKHGHVRNETENTLTQTHCQEYGWKLDLFLIWFFKLLPIDWDPQGANGRVDSISLGSKQKKMHAAGIICIASMSSLFFLLNGHSRANYFIVWSHKG